MNRRNFLSSVGITIGSIKSNLEVGIKTSNESDDGSIKGFIVSDAHIGWNHKDQPTVEEQKLACQNINAQFPDLDLVFDTGDAHHGSLNEPKRVVARTHWQENIANQFPTTPFHYVPGNHELGKGVGDPELTACRLGSMPFRPYYSFDYKGIHFISLPQLFHTIYITQETINWLQLDLLINQNKSTLIFSHNSLKGTTFNNGETGYRCLANSEQIMKVIDKNPQIMGWFHGHNHQYEVVNKNNKLFVSNGRIGGFVPPENWGPFGQGHLGGIYFEVNKKQLEVRAYSSTQSKFLDELGMPNLSNKVEQKTSFNSASPFNYYFGHGASSAGINYKYFNHYHSDLSHQVTYSMVDNNINEHPSLDMPTHYVFSNKQQIKMIGYKFSDNSIKYNNEATNLRVINKSKKKSFSLTFPHHYNPRNKLYKRGGYYRCATEQNYMLEVLLGGVEINKNQTKLKVIYLNNFYEPVFETNPLAGKNTASGSSVFSIKALIKTKLPVKYFRFELLFNNFPESFLIKTLTLRPANNLLNEPSLVYLNKKLPLNHELSHVAQKTHTPNHHSSDIYLSGTGNHLLSWVAKIPNVQWQARNAQIKKSNDYIVLTSDSAGISTSTQSIVTPTTELNFYPNVFNQVKSYRFKIVANTLTVRLDKLESNTFFTVVSTTGKVVCEDAAVEIISQNQYKITPKSNFIRVIHVSKI